MREWKYLDLDECPKCGNSLQVYTDGNHGLVYDDDEVRCVECPFRSGICVEEDGRVWVQDGNRDEFEIEEE